MTSSSLIVVSNRLPFVLNRRDDNKLYRKPSAGGLVTAVAPVIVQSGGKHGPHIHLLFINCFNSVRYNECFFFGIFRLVDWLAWYLS